MAMEKLFAQTMSPEEVYTRCYLQLTGMIPTKDSRYKNVLSKKISAATACRQIFDLARLGSNGVMVYRSNPVARRVIERVHNIHLNWFSQKSSNIHAYTAMVNDFEESALYFTRAALMSGQRFSSSVTLNSGLKGYRAPLNGTRLPAMERKRMFRHPSYFNSNVPLNKFRLAFYRWHSSKVTIDPNSKAWDLPEGYMSHFGKLQGVITQPPVKIANFFNLATFARLPAVRTELKAASRVTTINPHFGGGVLGSQNFIQTNTNLTLHLVPNGEAIIHRRLAARVYEDLLCHQLPTLLVSDVRSQVNTKSTYTYRHSSSCMQCHSSFDPLAYSYRNVVLTRSIRANVNDRKFGFFTETAMEVPQINNSKYFATLTPKGSYSYRTLLDKKLVKGNINNLAQLGNHIAGTNDFYLCSAKKYYKYFTGIDVQLVDREPSGSQSRVHQNTVIQLSQNLKKGQSVGKMLEALFNTEVYQHRDFLGSEVSK